MEERYFKYTGEPMLTRGDYGVGISGGHNTPEAPDHISTFDPDFGDSLVCSIGTGLESGDWVEISKEEWTALVG